VEIESDPKKRGVGKTVLVVDDSAVIRKLLAAAFLSDGFKTCAEAETAKKRLR
jgi:chemotaxis response regulator CheB